MDVGLAKRILDQIAKEQLSERVAFHVMGEPLLHPMFTEILAYTKLVGLKPIFRTLKTEKSA